MVDTHFGTHISVLQKHSNNCKGNDKNVGWGIRTSAEGDVKPRFGQKYPFRSLCQNRLFKSEMES